MSQTHLALDIGDNLQTQFAGDDTRHYVKVIGYLAGKSLVVTPPMVDGQPLPLRADQDVVVRLMSGNEIVGFAVKVLSVNARPYPHLHLSFPNNVQAVTVRKALRVHLNRVASVQVCLKDTSEVDPAQASHSVTIQDMSTSGALLIADQPLVEAGQSIVITARLDVANETEDLSLVAIVRNIRPERGEKMGTRVFHHGVELRLADRNQSIMIHAFVYQQIAQGQTRPA